MERYKVKRVLRTGIREEWWGLGEGKGLTHCPVLRRLVRYFEGGVAGSHRPESEVMCQFRVPRKKFERMDREGHDLRPDGY